MMPGVGRSEATDSFSDTLDEGREDSLLSGNMLDDGIGGICELESMSRVILSADHVVSKRSVEIDSFQNEMAFCACRVQPQCANH